MFLEGAPFSTSCFPFCRLAEDGGAADTQHCSLCVAVESGDFMALWASHIFEVGIGIRH